MSYEELMLRAITKADAFKYTAKPNPVVGAILEKDGEIISEGYHKIFGHRHAEINALSSAEKLKNIKFNSFSELTLICTLEPCSHIGKTGSCADAIVKSGIKRVIIGSVDPNSKVSGKGIQKMEKAGIKVVVGVLEEESKSLNKRFITFHENSRPYIILKWAESEDGFIAPNDQTKPFWMTSKESKKLVHKWRSEEDAILIGRITAEQDNPSLTVREVKGNNPLRIVIDKNLKLAATLKILNNKAKTLIFNEIKSEIKDTNSFIKTNFSNLINKITRKLHEQNVQSVIIEGGTTTLQSFIDMNIWDEARVFTTNKKLNDGVKAPVIKGKTLCVSKIDVDILKIIVND